MVLVLSPSVFANYSNCILSGSDSDQEHIWRIAITDFLVSVVDLCVASARDGVYISRTAIPKIAAEGYGMLVSLSERSVPWIKNLGFFATIKDTGFDPALSLVVSRRSREVDWDSIDLLDPFYSHRGGLA